MDLYVAFFKKAEDTRRWNIYKDIPWDKVNKDVSDDLAQLNEADVLHASTEVRHPHWAEMIQHRLRQRVRQALILGLPAMAQALHQMNQVEKELPSLHDILRTHVERQEVALACAG